MPYRKRKLPTKPVKTKIICLNCLQPFECVDYAKKRKFCSSACRDLKQKKTWKEHNPFNDENLSTPSKGTISELTVYLDLLKKGYNVLKSITPNCSFDLALLCNKNIYRLEVTTGSYDYKGNIVHSKKFTDKFDILCIVTKDGKITYLPPIPEN
jgi:hypothetical protein